MHYVKDRVQDYSDRIPPEVKEQLSTAAEYLQTNMNKRVTQAQEYVQPHLDNLKQRARPKLAEAQQFAQNNVEIATQRYTALKSTAGEKYQKFANATIESMARQLQDDPQLSSDVLKSRLVRQKEGVLGIVKLGAALIVGLFVASLGLNFISSSANSLAWSLTNVADLVELLASPVNFLLKSTILFCVAAVAYTSKDIFSYAVQVKALEPERSFLQVITDIPSETSENALNNALSSQPEITVMAEAAHNNPANELDDASWEKPDAADASVKADANPAEGVSPNADAGADATAGQQPQQYYNGSLRPCLL